MGHVADPHVVGVADPTPSDRITNCGLRTGGDRHVDVGADKQHDRQAHAMADQRHKV